MRLLLSTTAEAQERPGDVVGMVKARASFPVMAQLTGISRAGFTQLRRQLNLSEHDIGRYEFADEARNG